MVTLAESEGSWGFDSAFLGSSNFQGGAPVRNRVQLVNITPIYELWEIY